MLKYGLSRSLLQYSLGVFSPVRSSQRRRGYDANDENFAPCDKNSPQSGSVVGRQLKSIGHTYLFHSLIQVTQYTTADPRQTGEWDCRGLRKILRVGEQAGEKTLDWIVHEHVNIMFQCQEPIACRMAQRCSTVAIVTRLFRKQPMWNVTREFIRERDLSVVRYVGNHLIQKEI